MKASMNYGIKKVEVERRITGVIAIEELISNGESEWDRERLTVYEVMGEYNGLAELLMKVLLWWETHNELPSEFIIQVNDEIVKLVKRL